MLPTFWFFCQIHNSLPLGPIQPLSLSTRELHGWGGDLVPSTRSLSALTIQVWISSWSLQQLLLCEICLKTLKLNKKEAEIWPLQKFARLKTLINQSVWSYVYVWWWPAKAEMWTWALLVITQRFDSTCGPIITIRGIKATYIRKSDLISWNLADGEIWEMDADKIFWRHQILAWLAILKK